MNDPLRLLIIEDTEHDHLLVLRHLIKEGIDATTTRVDSEQGLQEALQQPWDLVISDYNVPGMICESNLQRLLALNLPVIVLSGSIGEEKAVDLLNAGAQDIVLKSNIRRLGATIRRTLEAAREHAARRKAEERLRLMAAVFDATQEGIAVTDLYGTVLTVNKAFTTITEFPAEEIIGQSLSLLQSGRHQPDFYQNLWRDLSATGFWQGEIWNRRKGGEIYPQWLTISTVSGDGGVTEKYVGIFTDISRIKHSTTHLEYLAHHDALTGLPNRLLLRSRLEHSLERIRRSGGLGALLFLDLDRFKQVNDTLGHRAGDDLLQQVASRIGQRLRDADTLARLGGDEFVVVLDELSRPEQAAKVATSIIQLLRQPFELNASQPVEIGCSIGISLFPSDGDQVDALLEAADSALYQVKRSGRNHYRFAQP